MAFAFYFCVLGFLMAILLNDYVEKTFIIKIKPNADGKVEILLFFLENS